MSEFLKAIDYLYSLQKHGVKLGLEKPKIILSLLGSPHNNFLTIHVAGTNGKGSVSAMIASILAYHGFKVGLFTSPHLVSFTERIRINNQQISENDVLSLTEEIRFKIKHSEFEIPEPTFFEFVTAMALLYFSRNKVDWAVIETGMGGRLDATNVITPVVSVITSISYDHKEFLGETITQIASEKAGIIKKGIPVVSSFQQEEAEGVISVIAKEKASPLFIYGKDFKGKLRYSGIKGINFDYSDSELNSAYELRDLFVPLCGEHQLINACVALKAALLSLKQISRFEICDSKLIRDGLSNTRWRGRLEIVNKDPLIMIDGAHNPDAADALAQFIEKHLLPYRIIMIIGVMADKDIYRILKPLLRFATEIIFTAPNYGRAASPEKLAEIGLSMGFSSTITPSVREALEKAIQKTDNSSVILITGSFYTIGEAMEILGEDSIMSTLRETL